MASKKAIKITNENKNRLVLQYKLDEDELDDRVGYWLVVGFGHDAFPDGYLQENSFRGKYNEVGKLENDFIEIDEAPL